MARVRMVTRTMWTTLVNVKVANLDENTITSDVLQIAGYFNTTDDKELQKTIKATYPDLLVVKIEGFEHIEKLYGMTEVEFLKYAKELPPRNGNIEETEE